FVVQEKQRGTGDAVETARGLLEDSDSLLLVLYGDMPLIRAETLKKLIEHHRETDAACSILSVEMQNPTGYGRIVLDEDGSCARIVEQRDATAEQRQIREINSGIYCFEARDLFQALRRVEPANEQGEYYLTDVAEIILSLGGNVSVYLHNDPREMSGVNTR